MEISAPHAPVKTKGRNGSALGEYRMAIEALAVGSAITVKQTLEKGNKGSFQSNLISRANNLGLTFSPRRKFTSSRLPDNSVQITRIE